MKGRKHKLMLQLLKFGVVGVIAALVDVGVLVFLKELLGMEVLLSSAISFCVSVTVNYLLSMAFVFKGKEQSKLKEFVLFVLLSIGGLLLNQLILWVGVSFTSVYYLVVKIFAMVIVPVYNFITRKLFLESR
ncbi:MAG: GtrA family protein [Oscillospiraceae bacterium]|nr:GtrA family protein [Oscillospiraceae bacterium]